MATGVDVANQAVRVQDPWDGQSKLKPLAEIQGGVGNGVPSGNPLTVPFESSWDQAYYETVTLPDYGDAPSAYLQSEPLAASHEMIYREYLGERVSYELDAFGASDDAGQANVNNNDRFDDGFELVHWNPGGSSIATVKVTHLQDFEIITEPGGELDVGDVLNVAAWFDWNHDTVWDANTEEAFSFSLLADFHGTQEVQVFFDTPIDADPTWMRLRLARGEAVTPYGGLLFGEVEDTLVPEPGTAVPLVIAGVISGSNLDGR